MLEHEDNFEEEFLNWAKAVFNLQNVRDGSISYIKQKMEPFIDELVYMHGPDEEEHFKELLIKVAVKGEVKKNKNKKNTKEHPWALYDTKCATCADVFKKILSKFKSSCPCKRWERHASKDSISPSNYWWIVSKLYISHNCELETSLGPEEVEPFAVLSLMSRCKLFHGNLLWFDVGQQVLVSRHELMHSINNRLSDDERDNYLLEMKTLIKNLAVDTSNTEVLKAFEEVENLEVALFTENGEIHQLANQALQLQETCLNADFKSSKGVHATIKSLAKYKIEIKKQEFKTKYKDQLEKKKYELQKKIGDLDRQLQYETERNKPYGDNLTEIRCNMVQTFENLQQEVRKQDGELSSLKSKIEELHRNLQHETEKNKTYEDNLTEIRCNTVQFEDLQQEIEKQDGEMSSLNSEMEKKFRDLEQEIGKQDNEMSSLKREIGNTVYDLLLVNCKQDNELVSLKRTVVKKFEDLQQEIEKQAGEISSIKSKMEIQFKDSQLEKSKQDAKITSLQIKIDELERKLQYETERNKTHEDNLTDISQP